MISSLSRGYRRPENCLATLRSFMAMLAIFLAVLVLGSCVGEKPGIAESRARDGLYPQTYEQPEIISRLISRFMRE